MVIPYLLRCYRVCRIYGYKNYLSHPSHFQAMVMREGYLLEVLAACLTMIMLIKLIFVAVGYPGANDSQGFACMGNYPIVWIITNVLEILAAVWVVCRLRNIEDDHGIANELTGVCAVWLAMTISLLVLLLAKVGRIPTTFYPATPGPSSVLQIQCAFLAARDAALFYFSLIWPLYRSYKVSARLCAPSSTPCSWWRHLSLLIIWRIIRLKTARFCGMTILQSSASILMHAFILPTLTRFTLNPQPRILTRISTLTADSSVFISKLCNILYACDVFVTLFLRSHSDAMCSLDSLLQDIICLQYFRSFIVSALNKSRWMLRLRHILKNV